MASYGSRPTSAKRSAEIQGQIRAELSSPEQFTLAAAPTLEPSLQRMLRSFATVHAQEAISAVLWAGEAGAARESAAPREVPSVSCISTLRPNGPKRAKGSDLCINVCEDGQVGQRVRTCICNQESQIAERSLIHVPLPKIRTVATCQLPSTNVHLPRTSKRPRQLSFQGRRAAWPYIASTCKATSQAKLPCARAHATSSRPNHKTREISLHAYQHTPHMPSLMAISQAKLLCAPAMPNRAVNYITSHATAVNAVPDLTPRQHRIRCSPPLRTAMQLGVQMLASFIEPYAWPPTQGNSDHHQQCASLCEPPAEPSRHARQPCQPSC